MIKYFPKIIANSCVLFILFFPVNSTSKDKNKNWEMPVVEEQIDMDSTLIPVGKGAIFVPSMYDPDTEPEYRIILKDMVIAEALLGKRAVVDPGTYEVLIGKEPMLLRKKVEVLESRTTVVEPDWTELLLSVVDNRSIPFRGSYELLRMPSREYVGIGLGAEIEEGEILKPWILPAGDYMMIKVGEDYQARKNFFTFSLREGVLEHFTLVMDRDTGDFLGAGSVILGEAKTGVEKNWLISMIISGDLDFNNKKNVYGSPSGNYISLSGFADTIATYRGEKNFLYFRLRMEEGQSKQPESTYEKTLDELRADSLYVYKVVPWFGPYLRMGLDTPILEGYKYFNENTDVRFLDSNGAFLSEEKGVKKTKISTFFSPLTLKGGIGVNFSTLNLQYFNLSTRLGPGFRQVFTGSLFTKADDESTPEYEMIRKNNYHQFGLEWIVVSYLSLGRYITVNTEGEIFSPFEDYKKFVFTFENTVALRLLSFASVNYITGIRKNPEISDYAQYDNRIVLRFSWKIF
jgi:hypothetical protein